MAKKQGPAINPKGCAAKMWPVEKPLLNAIARQKGYKRAPFKGGPPNGTVKGLLHVFHTVELKKPKAGHIREYRKKYEHTRDFLGNRRKSKSKELPSQTPIVINRAVKKPMKRSKSRFALNRHY